MTATAPVSSVSRSDAHMPEPRRRRRPILPLIYWVVVGITMVPIVFMIVYSFNDVPTGRISFQWSGFTPYWYQNLGQVSGLTHAFVTSIEIALLSALISIVLGVPMAIAMERYRFFGRGALNATVYADIAAPSIVVGAASLSFFLSASVSTGFLTILLVHATFNLAYVVVVLRARLSGAGTALEEAAGDLGASPLVTFRTVTLPLLLPGIIAGGMLSLAMSIDDYVITSFVAGPSVTFPLFVYGAAKVGLPPQVLCFGTIIFAVGLLVALVNALITRRVPRAASD